MSTETIITEARARIIWGEEASSVREFLISNGISGTDADANLHAFVDERNQELRKMGVRNILIGVGLVGAAGGTFYLGCLITSGTNSCINRSLVFVLIGLGYGLWKLGKGIVYLVRPQSEHKSIPDIVQSDLLD